MNPIVFAILVYFVIGVVMVVWDFRSGYGLHEPPRFLHDRSVSTAVVFILVWPYKLLKKYKYKA